MCVYRRLFILTEDSGVNPELLHAIPEAIGNRRWDVCRAGNVQVDGCSHSQWFCDRGVFLRSWPGIFIRIAPFPSLQTRVSALPKTDTLSGQESHFYDFL